MCAAYYGRTERLEEADEKFYRLCKWYNCIGTGLVEINRGETVSNFRKWKATKYLGYEPLYVWDSAVKEKVIHQSNKAFILADQTKFNKICTIKYANLDDVICISMIKPFKMKYL